MAIIGSAYVDIRAITDSLEADIKKALASLPDHIDVPVYANTVEAENQIDLLVEWGNTHKIDVNVDANVAAAEAHVDEAVKSIEHEEATININADTVGARAHVDDFVAAESHRSIDVPVDVDEVAAITKMAALRAKLDAIAGLKPITIPVSVGNGAGPIGTVENALRATSQELDKANLKLTFFGQAMKDAGDHAKTSASNVGEFLLKLSGLQGLTDLTKGLIALKINLGEEVPLIAMTAEKIGAMATGASYAVGNILSLASSVGQLGGVAAALPGIFTGLLIGMTLTTTAFGDMKKAVPDLAAEFQNLKNMISQNFWATARAGLMDLVGPTSVLRGELSSTSKTLGTFWGTMFEGMSKGSFAQAMAGDFENLRKSIEITTNGSSVFLHIIQTLGEFGSAYLPKLAQGFLDVSTRFDAFLTKANADGTLTRWVSNGVQGFKDLGGVIVNTAKMFDGLMTAAIAAGGTTLGTLNTTMEHFAAVVKEPGVQTALINIFSGANIAMKDAVAGLGDFLRGVGYLSPAIKVVEQDVGIAMHTVLTFFGDILTNPTLFKGIQDLFGGIILGLDHFVTALNPIGDKIGIFFTLVGTVADSLGGVFANAITVVLPLVSNLLTDLIPLVKPLGDITNSIVTALAPALGILATTAFPALINLLTQSVLPALGSLVPALGIALPPMAAALGDAIQKLAPIIGDLITHLAPIIEKLIEIASKAVPAVLNVLPGLVDGFSKLLKAIEPIITPILDLINHFLDSKGAGDVIVGALALVIATIGTFNVIIGITTGLLKGLEIASAIGGFIAALVPALEGATAATEIFAGALAMTGIGLIVIAVAALIAGIVLLIANWDAVTKAVNDFATDAGKNLTDFFNSTGAMFTDFNNNTNGMFTDFFNNTIGMFKDFFNNTVGMFSDFFNKTGQDLGNFNNDTNGMFNDFFNNTGGMFKDFFNNTVGMVTDFGKNTYGMFKDFFTNTIGMFTDFFNKVMEGFRGFAHDPIGEVHKFVDGIVNAVKDFGTTIIVNITKAFVDVKNAVFRWAVDTAADIQRFFVDTVNGFLHWRDDIINTVIRWVVDMATHVAQFELDVKNKIIQFVVNTVGMFKDFFNNTSGMFQDFWNNLPNMINTFISNTMGMIGDFNARTNGMFMDFFNNTLGMFSDFFTKNVPDTVNTFVSNTTGMINDFNNNTNGMFMDFFANTGGMFVDFFNNTVGMFVDFVNNCVNTINGWVGGLIGMFVGFYAQTTGETRAFLDGFIGSVGGFVNQTIGMFADFGNNTVGMFRDMWNNAADAVQRGIDTVVNWVQGVGGRIMDAIGNPGALLEHAGQAIMDGFLGGLTAGFKGVQDMVGGIGQWIADHKGPEEYDRALLVPHGGWIMGGLEKGIHGSLPSLQKTLTSVTDLVSDTMNGAISVNLSTGLNSAQGNPNIFTNPAARTAADPFDSLSSLQQGRYGSGTVITPTVNVYPSAPLNEAQVGQMAAQELYWNFISR